MGLYKSSLRKRIIIVSSIGASSVAIATTAGILAGYRDQLAPKQSSDAQVPSTPDGSNPDGSLKPSAPSSDLNGGSNTSEDNQNKTIVEEAPIVPRVGIIDPNVVSALQGVSLDFKSAESNQYGLTQNYLEFQENGDFSQYKTNWSEMEKDIYLFVYDLWINNNKAVDFTNVSISSTLSPTSELILNQSQISFDIVINIDAFSPETTLTILGKQFSVVEGIHALRIRVTNQTLKPIINILTNEYYLAWQINSATINLDSNSFTSVFNPCVEDYSYAFQYIFTNLTNQQNYIQFYKTNQSKLLKTMNVNDTKTALANYYDEQYSQNLDLVDYGISILNVIRQNPTIKSLLQDVVPFVAKMATSLNILPAFLEPLLSEGLSSNQSFLQVFANNNKLVTSYIEENMPDIAPLAVPLIQEIKPGMSSQQITDIQGLLTYFNLDPSIVNLLVNDFLGASGTPKTLYDIVIDNCTNLLTLIMGNNSNESIISGVSTLLNLITSVDANNQLTPIFTALFDTVESKTTFLEALGKIFNISSLTNVLDILVTNNSYINSTNIQAILNSFYNFVSTIFARNDNYSNFKTDYTNLTFTTKFDSDPKIDTTNQTLSFKYEITFSINKTIKLDLTPIKQILSASNTWTLINSFYDLSGYAWIINKDWLYQGIIGFIPSSLSVGGSSDCVTRTTYVANNSAIYVDGIANQDNYNLGFKFNYTTNIDFDDKTLVSSITNIYKNGSDWKQVGPVLLWADYYYSDFWRSILKNVITREYTFTNLADVKYSDEVVATTQTYNPNLYMTGFTVEENETLVTSDDVYTKLADYSEDELYDWNFETYNIRWSDTGDFAELLTSLNPLIPQSLTDYITQTNYTVNSNGSYLSGTNLKPYAASDAIMNFSIPIHIVFKYIVGKTDVNIKLDVFAMQYQLFLPFSYYDLTTGKMTDHFVDNYSHFNAQVGTTASWFWQSAFYN